MAKPGNFNVNKYFFFVGAKIFIVILLIIGFLGALFIFLNNPADIYKALGLLICVIWASIFLGYFYWAIYHYNINYGLSQEKWQQINDAQDRKTKGEEVPEEELKAPQYNPFRSQTFGFPPGTVRGMIAFTLLFGAIALMVVSMGMDGEIDDSSFFWDHFEFFKTAFLMMIAFYFGSRSLQYLQKRWPSQSRKSDKEEDDDKSAAASVGLGAEDSILVEQTEEFDAELKATEVSDKPLSALKNAMAASENKPLGLVPIIDAGHGGIVNGKYTTAPKKMYEFTSDGFTVYEGVVNRAIAQKLIAKLDAENIKYYDLNSTDNKDMPLSERTKKANEIYAKNKKVYYLSIHSNTASATGKGKGTTATGFEVWTSVGQTLSDKLADIAGTWYKKLFKDIRFRQDMQDGDLDKEAQFWVLRKTACPAILVENLFYDNREEANFLMSERGQAQIADCLFEIVKEIYTQKIK